MKRIKRLLILIILLVAGVVFYMVQKGHDMDSILNTPDKYDLTASCSEIENLIVSSTTNITVSNLLSRTHENVTVRITGYDKDGNITKQKESTFLRILGPKSEFSKPMTLPTKTVSCDCIVIASDPK